MDALTPVAIGLITDGCPSLYTSYRDSIVHNKLEKWTTRTQAALNEVIAVREYLEEDEIRTLCQRVDEILSSAEVLEQAAMEKSSWFSISTRLQTREFTRKARKTVLRVQRASAKAKTRQLLGGTQPEAAGAPRGQPPKASKKKEDDNVSVLQNVVNTWDRARPADDCRHTEGCKAHALLESAIASSTPGASRSTNGSSNAQSSFESGTQVFQIYATACVERAVHSCTCNSNPFEPEGEASLDKD
ncbi:hypothetical protein BDN72DRAFT_854200 [Pluteus cervinus]|uniref:Uncharacterized protein n=1 Tax=Pluteus cervinus TaxID=181527 RepID=A0ACD3B9C1_9AGAR|nr:hypothetical protein BDN72DRAFT_854200 [Pluteus cervinus]